ncbi:MAG: hypothetical protein KC933_09715 [Myxococcales bacterium]|nr:hypothetical protein [Myxococcales bacterium]
MNSLMNRWPAAPRILESAGWYALAFILTQILHEAAHAAIGVATGRGPTLHTSYVEYAQEASVAAQVACAAAGPLLSLLQGILLTLVVRRGPSSPRLRLALTWLAFHGLVNFVGYLFTTSFAPGGDLGRIAGLLELPLWARLGLTGLGYLGLRYLARPLAPAFVALAPGPLDEVGAKAVAKQEGVLAGAIATPALMLAALPVPHWLSLLYVACAFLPLFDLPGAAAKAHHEAGRTPLGLARPAVSVAAWVVTTAALRLIFDRGWPLG